MAADHTCELVQRINELEARSLNHGAQLRRWRVGVIGLLALLAVGVLAGGATMRQSVLEASAFILRAPDGLLRGSFVVGDDGGVRLTLLDEHATAHAGMWLERDGRATVWGFDNLHHGSQSDAMAASASGSAGSAAPQFNGVQAAPNQMHAAMQHSAYASGGAMLTSNRTIAPAPQMTMATSQPMLTHHAPTMTYATPAYERIAAPTYTGKLITLGSSSRVIERSREAWTCSYQLALRNETGMEVDQAFYVTFVDVNGFVLGRQAKIVRLSPGRQTMLTGELALSPERAQQVAAVKLAVWEP